MKQISKRQKIRRRIGFFMFLLFPVYINFLSPVMIIGSAYSGLISASFIFFGLLLMGSLFLGRTWCGWFCPAGSLQDSCSTYTPRNATKTWGRVFKYTYWVLWLALIAMFFIRAGGVFGLDTMIQAEGFISIMNDIMVMVYLGVVLLVYVMNVTLGERSFCKYVCWMSPFMEIGNKIRYRLKIPGLKLKVDASKCIDCGICTKTCPMSIDVAGLVKKGQVDTADCILCYQCADVCPKECLK